MRALHQLEKMKGKLYLYMGKHQRILYHIDQPEQEVVLVITDKTHHRVAYEKLAKYLVDFVGPVSEEPDNLPAPTSNKPPARQEVAFVVDTDTITSLKDTLLENIKKVKESKDYIPQAFEINQQVKTLMNLAKTEIELHKMNER